LIIIKTFQAVTATTTTEKKKKGTFEELFAQGGKI